MNRKMVGVLSTIFGATAILSVFLSWINIVPEAVVYTGWEIFQKGSAGFYEHDIPIYIIMSGMVAIVVGSLELYGKDLGKVSGILILACGAVMILYPAVFYYDNFVRDLLSQWSWTKIMETYEMLLGFILTEVSGISLVITGVVQIIQHRNDL